MIYVDTSVVLATLLSEDRVAPAAFWSQTLVSSRLLAVETWVRMHARGLTQSHADQTHGLLSRIGFVEMDSRTLARTLEPFPVPVRTLDAIHLATATYLQVNGQQVAFATFDERLAKAARRLRFELVEPAA
ncbi:MAG: PIN domain-containing protein [Planctomycetota bacterium]